MEKHNPEIEVVNGQIKEAHQVNYMILASAAEKRFSGSDIAKILLLLSLNSYTSLSKTEVNEILNQRKISDFVLTGCEYAIDNITLEPKVIASVFNKLCFDRPRKLNCSFHDLIATLGLFKYVSSPNGKNGFALIVTDAVFEAVIGFTDTTGMSEEKIDELIYKGSKYDGIAVIDKPNFSELSEVKLIR